MYNSSSNLDMDSVHVLSDILFICFVLQSLLLCYFRSESSINQLGLHIYKYI
jgi:hypothetical protein